MSTNQHSQRGRRGVTELREVKQRRRLETLLYTRTRVAQLSAQHRSHHLDDALDLYLLQLQVEQVIADEFPEAFENHVGLWAEQEAAAEHHPEVDSPDCAFCQAAASHNGDGWDAPTAA